MISSLDTDINKIRPRIASNLNVNKFNQSFNSIASFTYPLDAIVLPFVVPFDCSTITGIPSGRCAHGCSSPLTQNQ